VFIEWNPFPAKNQTLRPYIKGVASMNARYAVHALLSVNKISLLQNFN